MKKMNKTLAILLALAMMLALAACNGKNGDNGNSGNGNSGNGNSSANSNNVSTPQTTTASGDMVTVELPSGWSLVTGTDMNGADMADFICHTEKFEYGDPYLQVEEYPQDLDSAKAVLESGNPYGTYDGEKELTNGTWYLAENAASAQIGEKVFMVKGYECDFGSEEVQSILGSLQWAQ